MSKPIHSAQFAFRCFPFLLASPANGLSSVTFGGTNRLREVSLPANECQRSVSQGSVHCRESSAQIRLRQSWLSRSSDSFLHVSFCTWSADRSQDVTQPNVTIGTGIKPTNNQISHFFSLCHVINSYLYDFLGSDFTGERNGWREWKNDCRFGCLEKSHHENQWWCLSVSFIRS
jgi:hypothetical protein